MTPVKFKRDFLCRVNGFEAFEQLFDLLPDVAFFVKDRKSRLICYNRRAVESCGFVNSEAAVIGKLGYEYYSAERMAMYLEQDRRVMETGVPIINGICPSPETGSNALIVFSKVPLRDRSGHIIGLAGVWREVRGLHAPPAAVNRLSQAVEIMHTRYAEALSMGELAKIAHLSVSQFGRQFHRLFGTTPREYLLRVRVNAAGRLLAETDRKTTDIALETGFFDHSHFSRTFRRLMGISPQTYRHRHAIQ
jgi:AraC-like DNA-binding protein